MKRKDWLILVAGLLAGTGLGVLIFFGLGFWNGQAQSEGQLPGKALTTSPAVGALAPDFELVDLSGETVRLSDLRGKPVLLNFWATWCAPCKLEMPAIQERFEQHQAKFSVLAIDFDEPEQDVRQFAKQLELTFNILLDPGAKVQDLYRVRGYPTTFLVDAEGVIRVHHVGLITEAQLDRYLQQVGIDP
ncbi:MAG TPA: redoxin domain-containing protein [Anaerolineales bacterium]|nr:redoxin domain-containing protein [Anaerolineales bacterium]